MSKPFGGTLKPETALHCLHMAFESAWLRTMLIMRVDPKDGSETKYIEIPMDDWNAIVAEYEKVMSVVRHYENNVGYREASE